MLSMEHILVLENFNSAAVLHTVKYHYLFEGHKVFEYETDTDLLNKPGI